MKPSFRSRLAGAGLVLLFVAAACSDSTAPTFSDPAAISADLQQVNDAFASGVYESFSGLSAFMAPGGGPVASALLRATSPEALLEQDQPRSALAARQLHAMIPQLSGPALGPIIHDSLYGRVYSWDETNGHYVQSATNGPANGVRFMLYAVDPFTGLPSSPLTVVGAADLLDESAGSTLSLHLLVRNAAGTVTYVDYTASVTGGASSFSAGVTGFVSNGLSGGALRRLDFDIAFSASGTETTADVSADAMFDVANSGVSLEVHDDAHVTATAISFSRDFRLHRPGEVVTLVGEVTITQTAPDSFTISGTVTIRINGGVFVTITFNNDGVTPSRELTEQEQQVVLHLLEAVEHVWDAIEDFFDPLNLFAA